MAVTTKIACLGECMIELNEPPGGGLVRSFGGDSLNTCLYAARLGAEREITAYYFTALGDDPYSKEMLAAWRAEGIGTENVTAVKDRLPGLYAIRTDGTGERSFHYWRDRAPARDYWSSPDWQVRGEALAKFDIVYLSGISVSILPEAGRKNLLQSLSQARAAGARIAFDINYRPRGWDGAAAATAALKPFFAITDIALPGLEDMTALYDCPDIDTAVAVLKDFGISEIVVKNADQGCWIEHDGRCEHVAAIKVASMRDSTAAGDSFNAAYLVARLKGGSAKHAAGTGAALAARVIQHPGAIIPIDAMPDLL